MILVGTSGFSYPDWVGPFYPPGTRPTQMLDWYAREFEALEVNFTYYRLRRRDSWRRCPHAAGTAWFSP